MSIYYFNPRENVRIDWHLLGVTCLSCSTINSLTNSDVILIHASDIEGDNNWVRLQREDNGTLMCVLREKIKAGCYNELVFFTGGGWSQFTGDRDIVRRLRIACGEDVPNVVMGPDDVAPGAGAVPAFGGFVKAYKSDPTCSARDFFSAHRREMEVTFRLLAQVWLVATDKLGDTKRYFSDENIRKALAGKSDTVNGLMFWKPVLATYQKNDGGGDAPLKHAPLHEELKRCFEKNNKGFLVGEYPVYLKTVHRKEWIDWAFEEKEQRGS